MKKILEQYEKLYFQILNELVKKDISSKERATLIEMLYNIEININQAKLTLNIK